MQPAMPTKCPDLGIFSIPCTIDDCTFADAMLDLSASINFNIFEAMKHPTEDHFLFSIDIIEELVEDYMQSGTSLVEISNFVETTHVLDTFDYVTDDSDSIDMTDVLDFADSVDDFFDLANMIDISNFSDLANLEYRCDGDAKRSICVEIQVAIVGGSVVAEAESVSSNRFRNPIEVESASRRPLPYLAIRD
ncbi:hypothetical protein CR513_13601, partial [Mucuna pruriens]